MTDTGDVTDVGVVQELVILSRELVDDDLDSSLRFSLESFVSSFSTCLKNKITNDRENYFHSLKNLHKHCHKVNLY